MEYDVWQNDFGGQEAPPDDQLIGGESVETDNDDIANRLLKDEVRQRSAIEAQARSPTSSKFTLAKLRSMINDLLPTTRGSAGGARKLSSDEYLRNLVTDANTDYSALPDPESHKETCHFPEGLNLIDYCDPDNLNGNDIAQSYQKQLVTALNQLAHIEVNTKCASRTTYKVGFGFAGPKTVDGSRLLKQTFQTWRLGHTVDTSTELSPGDSEALEECDTSLLILINLSSDGAIRVRREVGGFVSHTSFNTTMDKTLQIAESKTSNYQPQIRPLKAAVAVADLLKLQLAEEVRLPRQPNQAYALAAIFTIVLILFTGALIQTYQIMVARAGQVVPRKKKKKKKNKEHERSKANAPETESLIQHTVELPSPE